MTDPWLVWPAELRESAQKLIDLALAEDLGGGDVTARYFGDDTEWIQARLVARGAGVLAGLPLFLKTFQSAALRLADEADGAERGLDDEQLQLVETTADGEHFASAQVLARFKAAANVLHAGERTALNFLQRLSGVASLTAKAVAMSAGPAILDTRKTTPGYRLLEKYAVRMGGGINHRLGLYDAMMVKDNHKNALGGIRAVMDRVAKLPTELPLIVEVDNLAELAQVLDHPSVSRVTRILLDNFPARAVAQAVGLRESRGGGPDFEISGGLSAADLAQSEYRDVEFASLGSITHGARALDLALEFEI